MGKYDFDLELYDDNTISWIADSVKEESRVLEFGPANGRLTKYLHHVKKCVVDIVEIDEESGKDASVYAETAYLGYYKGDIEKFYWVNPEIKYDYIIFADVLEHLIHPEEVLKRCKAVINVGGKILVSVPNISHNSVIIELFNDRFMYNPTGILDNTHLRFYTHDSFSKMAIDAGWAVIGERSKNIRVGETEINNSYKDVSKEMFKELIHRSSGNVYQYMFILALSSEYLLGQHERIVSLDSTSYYNMEMQLEYDGKFDYKKSVCKNYDPYYKYVDIEFPVLEDSSKVLIKLINCNCVLQNLQIFEYDSDNQYEVDISNCNGKITGNMYCFFNQEPSVEVCLKDGIEKIKIKFEILNYDFEDTAIHQICDYYDDELKQKQDELKQKQDELKYKEHEYLKSVQIYENEIARREKERLEILANSKTNNSKRNILKQNIKGIKNKIKKTKVMLNPGSAGSVCETQDIRSITAVIPNYNYAKYLDERIDSILFQTYPVSEIIILDDCSTDNSKEVIKRRIENNTTDIPISFIANEVNSGSVFAQWQKAFEFAKSEYVWIAEADDSCNERFLETVMNGFDDKDVVISYCESLTIDENNTLLMGDLRVWIDIFNTGKWDEDYVNNGIDEVSETMCINNTIANVSSAVIKNGDYFEILEAAKKYKLAGDWYTYMNILKNGKIAYFKESLNYHRMQTQGLTLSTSHKEEFDEIVRLQDYALQNFDISDEVKNKVFERRERERARFGL